MTDEETPDQEKEEVVPQDDPEVVETLESFGARLDLNEDGWVWRVILYEKGGCDEALEWVKRLPELTELWVIYTKVSPQAIEALQKERPELTIYK
uniref:Uncharacterized protein n=1 Tax=Thermocrispum agreste TaxID=37925 RepID=A0A2W4KII1_9PSEU|nr:MAG: hypothetical protein DIU77_20670 [Thermocrispum agreste]